MLAGRRVASLGDGSSATQRPAREPCLSCGGQVRRCRHPLRCSLCHKACHKICTTSLSRDELDRPNPSWTCDSCAPPSPGASPLDTTEAGDTASNTESAEFLRRGCLRVMHWNADGVKAKAEELGHFINTHRVDVCLVQESKLIGSDRTPRFPGYTVVRQDRLRRPAGSARGGGLLTLIREDVPFRKCPPVRPSEGSALESLSVVVPVGGGDKLTIVNVYCPPSRLNQREEGVAGFDPATLPSHRRVLIGGDLNVHSPLWDPFQPGDALGEEVEQWLLDRGMMCLNDGSATHVNRGTGGQSAPDVTIMHGSRLAGCDWKVSDRLGSDHSAVMLEVACGGVSRLVSQEAARRTWRWKQANWSAFAEAIERSLEEGWESRRSLTLDARVRFLTDVILEAAQAHIGEAKVAPLAKPWLTREIRAAIKERNRLGRQISEHRVEWLEACKQVRELIAKEKERRWHSFVEKLDGSSDPSRVWRVIRSLGGPSDASRARNEILVHKGKEYSTGAGKADVFCRHYASVSRLEFSREERKRSKEVWRRLRGLDRGADDQPECSPFTEMELLRAIGQMKGRAAGGEDGVAPRFLKNLGPVGRSCLLECLNASWETGYCPQSWRSALIIPLPKAGKPASRLESYRPVSLTSCVGKTLERMIAGRLQHLAEERGLWVEEQAGFRKRRCTEDQVLRLSQDISDGFQRVPSQRTALALLDYSKAYDRVWREGLLDRMMVAGLPRQFVAWIAGFLRNRLGRGVCGGEQGKRKIFRQGLPQGSVLSPLLFLFYVNELVSVVPESVRVSLYADDVAVWSQDRCKERALQKVSEAVGQIARWSAARKLQLSEGKCTLSFFSQHPGEASWRPEAVVEGLRLKFEPKPIFLGVGFDRVLSFRPHAEMVAARASARSRALAALAGQSWGWRRKSLVPVFLAFVRSVLDYCGAGWQPWLAPSSLDILTRAQNRALRIITGQCRTTPVEALALEAGVPQYPTVARRLCIGAYEKALRLPEGHPRRIAAEGAVPHRMKRNSSWRREAERVGSELGLGDSGRTMFGPVSTAPWSWSGWANCVIATDLVGAADRAAEAVALRTGAVEATARWQGETVLYTDGSLLPDTRVGGSAAVVLSGPPGEEQVTDGLSVCLIGASSSFEVEVRALGLAAQLVESLPGSGRVVICSDSKSALECLRLPTDGERSDLSCVRADLSRLGREVVLQWVPGHCGLPGNEVADRVAKAAANFGATAGGALSDEMFEEVVWSELDSAGYEEVGNDDEPTMGDAVENPAVCCDGRWRERVKFAGVVRSGLSYDGVKSLIRREVSDPLPLHPRVRAVYCAETAGGPGPPGRRATRVFDSYRFTRGEGVLLAQLRTGHCPALAAYRALVSPGFNGNCPLCLQAPQTVEHWLQECDASASVRMRILGASAPHLSVLRTDPEAVVAYARASLCS